MVLENPMELFSITVEILDINDNSPVFSTKEITLDISELAVIGARLFRRAVDADVGINTLQSYSLKPTHILILKSKPSPRE
uniref:Cadherin domain-containing protein n=1 Tax=Anguilla anguilla TaxID=7936 RepID=A0A0E9R541_ANGAN